MSFDDIHKPDPYIDVEIDGNRALIHMLYVPPEMRKNGVGRQLVEKTLKNLPETVNYVRLKSANLGAGCTLNFWKQFGFTEAYISEDPDVNTILNMPLHGTAPAVETVDHDDERHYIFD